MRRCRRMRRRRWQAVKAEDGQAWAEQRPGLRSLVKCSGRRGAGVLVLALRCACLGPALLCSQLRAGVDGAGLGRSVPLKGHGSPRQGMIRAGRPADFDDAAWIALHPRQPLPPGFSGSPLIWYRLHVLVPRERRRCRLCRGAVLQLQRVCERRADRQQGDLTDRHATRHPPAERLPAFPPGLIDRRAESL